MGAETRRHRLSSGDTAVSWAAFAAGLRADRGLRSALTEALIASPYSAFFWETPAVSARSTTRPFEMVVVSAPHLARAAPSPTAFAEHLEPDGPAVRTFANLGGDATLVVPRPLTEHAAYGHLAAFLRGGPAAQIDALWQAVGAALEEAWERSSAPVWLSTSGSAVPWLHVRLDARPKYYVFGAYRAGGEG
ncbi:DUF6940 family protein [Nannocystis pusilla]|uniref:DUF6940 family protein n=1 Tax=Nannocystis pusilla TaxID=889268 RepID=UPI003DA320AB